jgi:hypothetical protein
MRRVVAGNLESSGIRRVVGVQEGTARSLLVEQDLRSHDDWEIERKGAYADRRPRVSTYVAAEHVEHQLGKRIQHRRCLRISIIGV